MGVCGAEIDKGTIKPKIKNEIILKIKIEEFDINKDIYFLNNVSYKSNEELKRKYQGVKEINFTNTTMFIDNKRFKFTKFKKFDKKGNTQFISYSKYY